MRNKYSAFIGLSSKAEWGIRTRKFGKTLHNLTKFPYFNTAKINNFDSMWNDWEYLTDFPVLNTSNGTNFDYSWGYCRQLKKFPVLDLLNGTSFDSAWWGCSSLIKFPIVELYNGVDFYHAWKNCKSLIAFPKLDLSSGKTFNGTWSFCESLNEFPFINVSNGKTFQEAWNSCRNLKEFPPHMFDNLQNPINDNCFYATWSDCCLTEVSVENILVSIDKSQIIPYHNNKKEDIELGCESRTLTNKALEAKESLENKGWDIIIEGGKL